LLSLLMRNALPRVRIDQLMAFNWKFLVPLSIVNLLVTALLLKIAQETGIAPSPEEAHDFLANIPLTILLLIGNGFIAFGVLTIFRNQGREERLAEEEMQGRSDMTTITASAGD